MPPCRYWSRQVTYLHFANAPNGYPGNDDYGAMSSFLLSAAIGLFPSPGLGIYMIGSPRVKSITLQLQLFKGQSTYSTLQVVTYNNSKENTDVEKLLVNGVEWTSAFIDRNVLADPSGVKLEFYMSATKASGLCTK